MDATIIEQEDGRKLTNLNFNFETHSGYIIRAYNKEKKEYHIIDSYFDIGLPRWIKTGGVDLLEGKGTPSVLYCDMYAMKTLKLILLK